MSRQSHIPFPVSDWGAFCALKPVGALLAVSPSLVNLVEWPTPDEWQERALDISAFRNLNVKFSLEEKPGQRARRKIKRSTLRSYEQWIFESGEIPTRAQNLHDFFNAIIWMNFPHAKYALHRNAFAIQRAWPEDPLFTAGKRSPLADRLTIFDEGGAVFELAEGESRAVAERVLLGYDQRLKEEFVRTNRKRFTLFGHGILEVLMKGQGAAPQRVNASCVLLEASTASLDAKLAEYLAGFSLESPQHGNVEVGWMF